METNCVETRTMRSQSEAHSVTQWIKPLRVTVVKTVGETVGETVVKTVVKESHE